jgi:hypothetical protein
MDLAASGSRVKYYYCVEDANGDIHATTPTFQPIRFNTSSLSRDTAQIDSNEINPARQRPVSRQGTNSIQGQIVSEFAFGALDYLIAACLQSTWQNQATITGTTLSAAASDNSFNDSGNGFVAAGFVVGNRITVTGFTGDTANNVTDAVITSVAAGKIIVSGATLVNDSAGESVTIQTAGDWLYVGSTVPTIAILERHADVTASATITGTTISATASDNSYNDSGNGFVTAGFEVGNRVNVRGFTGNTANNITAGIITSVAAGKIIIGGTDGDVIADDAAGESVTIELAGDYLHRGCRVSEASCAFPLNAAALFTCNAVGVSTEEYNVPATATLNAATSTGMMVTTSGYLREDGTTINYATDYNFTLTNNMNPLFSLFQREAYSVENGVFNASGTMTAYFPNGDLFGKYIDETETNHVVRLEDQAGTSWYRFIFPSVNYTQASKDVGGQGALLPQYTLSAGYDGVSTVIIERTT